MATIDVTNLSRSFGKSRVLKDVCLRVEEGCAYGLVGLNGAGKTTLIRVLLGLIRRDGGSVSVCGFDPWRHEPAFYRMAGATLESDGFCGNLGVRDNLRVFAAAKGVPWAEAERYFGEYWTGTDIYESTRKVKYLSRGQRTQCGLARAFLGWPKVYFFDEPVVSLDIRAYGHFKAMVMEARSRGAAAIISSHQLEAIDELCDRAGLLRDGVIEELDRGGGLARWLVRVDVAGDWGKVVADNGGVDIAVNGDECTFSIDDEAGIPAVVAALVGAGCGVCEVRRADAGFSGAVKNIYGDSVERTKQ
ncbi:MAG: ABC transporter ATP-binding protein [Chitinispirillales bacterium]|jgi:ABC-type multidrug transport system ATPase subunit|nr:ABC transporter ATP-binding protein [Chitinispirillales bacterium]